MVKVKRGGGQNGAKCVVRSGQPLRTAVICSTKHKLGQFLPSSTDDTCHGISLTAALCA